ncbi:MAG: MBOAT family protein [Deltaproteobacteria bacterium]|nr:MBOAT family protein [Deltaproteobacteria bacterium]
MPFSSLLFVHAFLPAFLVLYWLTPRSLKNHTAIFGSLVFYAWGAPRFLPVVLGLGAIDYILSHQIAARSPGRSRRTLLVLGVALHLSILVYFKYSNFFVDEMNGLLTSLGFSTVGWTKVVLPIGVSFITFEEITYLVDVYRGDAKPANRISHYLLFLTLFPHSIAGPIFRWKDLQAQLVDRPHGSYLVEGFERFSLGLAKKVLVADTLAIPADLAFLATADQLTPAVAWIGAIAYTLQIYFDFSGYSDMAIGLGKMLGFTFKENFNQPYVSASLTEFWSRWHISLSNWLRDYLYIPLGGNRLGRRRAIINLFIVFTLSGLWHGPAWTFVAWGAFHGGFVASERLLGARRDRIPLALQHIVTLGLVVVGWVLFRATSLGHAGTMLGAMIGISDPNAVAPIPADFAPRYALVALAFGVLATVWAIFRKYRPASGDLRWAFLARLGYVALLVASVVHLTNMRSTPLIYFKF